MTRGSVAVVFLTRGSWAMFFPLDRNVTGRQPSDTFLRWRMKGDLGSLVVVVTQWQHTAVYRHQQPVRCTLQTVGAELPLLRVPTLCLVAVDRIPQSLCDTKSAAVSHPAAHTHTHTQCYTHRLFLSYCWHTEHNASISEQYNGLPCAAGIFGMV
jgi:hypothetical protein